MSDAPNASIQHGYGLVVSINAPEFFQRDDFIRFIEEENVWTWHNPGETPSCFSDVCLLLEPCLNGDGPDSEALPQDIREVILGLLRAKFGDTGENVPAIARDRHMAVWITNIDDD